MAVTVLETDDEPVRDVVKVAIPDGVDVVELECEATGVSLPAYDNDDE